MALSIAISPQGRLHLEDDAEATRGMSAAAEQRIRAAFEHGPAAGLEHLGSVEFRSELPASLAFIRDFARDFFIRLSRTPGLEGLTDLSRLEPDADELAKLLHRAPPLRGAEYLTVDVLWSWWVELDAFARGALKRTEGGAAEYLRQKNPLLRQLGRVTFHLAENKKDADRPFAFMATWTNRVSVTGALQHQPLSRALQEYAGANNRLALKSLLGPIDRAGEKLPWVKRMIDDSEIFRASAWTAAQAHQFLIDVPTLEASGLTVRVPDWWSVKRPPRPIVSVKVGEATKSALGVDSLLDFSVSVTLEGQDVSPAELKQLLTTNDGLVRLRGNWVEIDNEKLQSALDHWKEIEANATSGGGISFVDGMRLLAGAGIGDAAVEKVAEEEQQWTGIIAGEWLSKTLDELRDPKNSDPTPAGLIATLRPYQEAGVHWLRFMTRLRLGACLADDMGLGKTIQVIAMLLHAKATGTVKEPSLLVVPTSLIANWKSELVRFSPSLKFEVAHPSEPLGRGGFDSSKPAPADLDLVITTYGMLQRDEPLRDRHWYLAILDEAQAIKNSGTRQTRAVKQLKAGGRVALTGTPVENRLSDLWSLFDFLNPGLLGSSGEFSKYVKTIERSDAPSYAPLRELVAPYILRRLKTDRKIISDLPDKTEVTAFCGLTKQQAVMYEQAVRELGSRLKGTDDDGMKRRGIVLAFLLRFKQICNHPSQWLGDGLYDPTHSGKFQRLAELCEELSERQEKVLVFTQFREMTEPLNAFLQTQFGRPGLVLHGGSSVPSRRQMVDQFQQDDGPPYFVLSLKAGGTGLNLTQASQVIHFDRWWNPAVEQQATDRAFRIGQKKNVMVHKFVCRGTVEEKIDKMIADKRGLSNEVLSGGAEKTLTELGNQELMNLVSLDLAAAVRE